MTKITLLLSIATALLAVAGPYATRESLAAMPTDQAQVEAPGTVSSGAGLGSGQFAQAQAVDASSSVSKAGWLIYHNPATGLSFRYPPSLRIDARSPRQFGMTPQPQEVTDLVGQTRTNPRAIVLRFIVYPGTSTTEIAAGRISMLKRSVGPDQFERSATSIQLDGHEALVTVYCGRAACHWEVDIFQPRHCSILSPLVGDDAAYSEPPLGDHSDFPLLTIIQTVHFDSSPSK